MRRRLPLGIQNFREVREEGCYYVDKTPWIGQLLDRGKYYFPSRPTTGTPRMTGGRWRECALGAVSGVDEDHGHGSCVSLVSRRIGRQAE